MDRKIIDTVIALDVSFRSLLRAMSVEQPALALRLQDVLADGSTNRTAGLPGVTKLLAEYAELLTTLPMPPSRQ